MGECGKLEFGLNFDKPVLNEQIWIPRIHIVAAVQKILIPKQFLAVFCTFNVKKGFFSVNEKCCKTLFFAIFFSFRVIILQNGSSDLN